MTPTIEEPEIVFQRRNTDNTLTVFSKQPKTFGAFCRQCNSIQIGISITSYSHITFICLECKQEVEL